MELPKTSPVSGLWMDGWDQCYFERRGHNEQHKHYNGHS